MGKGALCLVPILYMPARFSIDRACLDPSRTGEIARGNRVGAAHRRTKRLNRVWLRRMD